MFKHKNTLNQWRTRSGLCHTRVLYIIVILLRNRDPHGGQITLYIYNHFRLVRASHSFAMCKRIHCTLYGTCVCVCLFVNSEPCVIHSRTHTYSQQITNKSTCCKTFHQLTACAHLCRAAVVIASCQYYTLNMCEAKQKILTSITGHELYAPDVRAKPIHSHTQHNRKSMLHKENTYLPENGTTCYKTFLINQLSGHPSLLYDR